MAIRRSPKFRFDYFLRSLPVDILGRRCEHLMRAAVKEVEDLEKRASEAEQMEGEDDVALLSFKELKKRERERKANELSSEREKLEANVEELEKQISEMQNRLKELSKENHDQRSEKDEAEKVSPKKQPLPVEEAEQSDVAAGAPGPDGEIVAFPDYSGSEPPKEARKAFTHFCVNTRKEVKKGLPEGERKDKEKVNSILKARWLELGEDERVLWRSWASWDKKRYAHELSIYEKVNEIAKAAKEVEGLESTSDKRKATESKNHIPKKKQRQE